MDNKRMQQSVSLSRFLLMQKHAPILSLRFRNEARS
jgi:hypothetical protein